MLCQRWLPTALDVRLKPDATGGRDDLALRGSPEVHRRHAVDAADRAVRRAPLRREELALDVFDRVGVEGHAGKTALLGAVVDQTVLADVEIPGAGAAPPLVRLAVGELLLKIRNPGIEVLEHLPRSVDCGRHVVVDLALLRTERLQQ